MEPAGWRAVGGGEERKGLDGGWGVGLELMCCPGLHLSRAWAWVTRTLQTEETGELKEGMSLPHLEPLWRMGTSSAWLREKVPGYQKNLHSVGYMSGWGKVPKVNSKGLTRGGVVQSRDHTFIPCAV